MRNGPKVFPNPHSTLNLDGEFPSSEGLDVRHHIVRCEVSVLIG